MDINEKIEEIVNFQIEEEEMVVKDRKQRKIQKVTEQNLRALVMDRISGRTGDC